MTKRKVNHPTETWEIEWTSEKEGLLMGHKITIENPSIPLIDAVSQAWLETEGQLREMPTQIRRFKPAAEIIDEVLDGEDD